MAFNIENPVGTGTDDELLAFTRAAIARITLHGTAYTVDGMSLTRADLGALQKQAEWLEARISAASSSRTTTNHARLGRPE
jgi:hypothetical protein